MQLASPMKTDLYDKQTLMTMPFDTGQNEIAIEYCNEPSTQLIQSRLIQNYVHIPDRVVPPRAVAVLPPSLQIRRATIFPRRPLLARVRFGPVEGVSHRIFHVEARELIFESAISKTPIFLQKKDVNSVTHLDVSDRDKSNWMSLLPLGDQSTANVWLYEEDGKLFGITAQSLTPRTPLKLGYSKTYAETHGLPTGLPFLDLTEELPVGPRQRWCSECCRIMPSATQLQHHIDVFHKRRQTRSVRRRYRCPHCTRTFSRLFTLKRHMLLYCSKTADKPSQKDTPDIKLNINKNMEDNKLPSDESLQNYTNNLDFSTTLFDTDRMPNFDISGSSKSENDFNPYSMESKIDYSMSNYLEFAKFSNEADSSTNECDKNTQQKVETLLVSCPYCEQTIVRGKLRQHVRKCPARRHICGCGKVFLNKENLAQHIYSTHPSNTSLNKVTNEVNGYTYKCEECPHTFKRRGMYVNHLWRVHKNMSAVVPLERCVRHYPCGSCPKIYRTAAKRDHHVRNHHPEAQCLRTQSIEGGRRACEPAACWACPRQYVTRAKMLQHMRAHHPHLAPPSTKRKPSILKLNENKEVVQSRSEVQSALVYY